MKLGEFITKIISKYIGNLEYVVTIVSTDGSVGKRIFKNTKEVDNFVIEINKETYYDVQKIEKFRRYDLKYNKNVLHTPLWFKADDVTEMYNYDNYDYSYIIIDESLTNVTRTYRKNDSDLKGG